MSDLSTTFMDRTRIHPDYILRLILEALGLLDNNDVLITSTQMMIVDSSNKVIGLIKYNKNKFTAERIA